ncbi:MAG: endonuclease/exonuclease/phosphatase family protein [Bacteroidales bacterium]
MARKRRKGRPSFISIILLMVNILVIIATAAAYLSNWVSPDKQWQIAFAGLALPLIIAVNFVFILLWLFVRPRFALISLLALIAGFNIISRFVQLNYPDEFEKTGKRFEVMSYNAHHFKLWGEYGKPDYKTFDAASTFFAEHRPSLLCLQEGVINHPVTGNLAGRLRKDLEYDGVYARSYYDGGVSGFIILHNGQRTGQGEIRHGDRVFAVYADLEMNGIAFRVYNVHLQSVKLSKEEYVMDNLTPEAYKDTLFVKGSRQIARKLKYAFIERSFQADLLRQHIENCLLPVVVCGDLNDTPCSYAYTVTRKGLHDAFVYAGKGFGRTYHGKFPSFRIDYIFASKDFSVKSFDIYRKKFSDHYPISSWLEFQEKPL